MKRSVLVLLSLGVTSFAAAQIVSSPQVNGWAKASTSSWDWRYVPSGGGRGSHNYHWAPIGDQSKGVSVSMPLNGTTGTQTETGTYFSPSYIAKCWGTNSFANSATQAVYQFALEADSTFNPTLNSLDGASVGNDVLNEFFFSLSKDSDVAVKITASSNAIVGFKNLTNGDVYFWGYGSGTLSTTLPGGCTYELFVHLVEGASKDNYLKQSVNVGSLKTSVTGALTVTPSSGGGGGDGGD